MVRVKSRYFVLLVKAKDGKAYDSIGPALPAAIRASVQLHLGDAALAAVSSSSNFAVPFYHHLSGVAIVRVGRAEHAKVLQACLRVSQADYKGVSVQLLKLTGAFRVAKRDAADHIARRLPAVLSPQHEAVAAALAERLAALY